MLDVETVTQRSELLGRQKVHDERSRAYAHWQATA